MVLATLQRLQQQLPTHLHIKDVKGDGNCFFRSLAEPYSQQAQLMTHAAACAQSVRAICATAELQRCFDRDLAAYIGKMELDGVYEDELTTHGFCCATAASVTVAPLIQPQNLVTHMRQCTCMSPIVEFITMMLSCCSTCKCQTRIQTQIQKTLLQHTSQSDSCDQRIRPPSRAHVIARYFPIRGRGPDPQSALQQGMRASLSKRPGCAQPV